MLKKLCLLILFISNIANANNYVGVNNTKIIRVSSYNQYGNGDVVFVIENPIAQCSGGYWITKDDKGFNANLSMILSAYQAKNPVTIFGLPDQLWSGSSGKFCKLYNIDLH